MLVNRLNGHGFQPGRGRPEPPETGVLLDPPAISSTSRQTQQIGLALGLPARRFEHYEGCGFLCQPATPGGPFLVANQPTDREDAAEGHGQDHLPEPHRLRLCLLLAAPPRPARAAVAMVSSAPSSSCAPHSTMSLIRFTSSLALGS